MPTRVIEDCLPILAHFVTSIINASSLSSDNKMWKTAEIFTYVFQKKVATNLLIDKVRSKVCETVVYSQFIIYL